MASKSFSNINNLNCTSSTSASSFSLSSNPLTNFLDAVSYDPFKTQLEEECLINEYTPFYQKQNNLINKTFHKVWEETAKFENRQNNFKELNYFHSPSYYHSFLNEKELTKHLPQISNESERNEDLKSFYLYEGDPPYHSLSHPFSLILPSSRIYNEFSNIYNKVNNTNNMNTADAHNINNYNCADIVKNKNKESLSAWLNEFNKKQERNFDEIFDEVNKNKSNINLEGESSKNLYIEEKCFSDAYEESKKIVDEQQHIKLDYNRARNLVDGLQQLGESKISNSEFLKFLEKFAEGKLNVKDNELVDEAGRVVNWGKMFRNEAQEHLIAEENVVQKYENEQFKSAWQEAIMSDDDFLRLSNFDFNNKTTSLFDYFDAAWNGTTGNSNLWDRNHFQKVWEGAGSEDDLIRGNYVFAKENSYLGKSDLLKLAENFLLTGRTSEAILALEAEVIQNEDSSEGWRLLGQTHADNEQDVEAIICLKKGHEVDPYNLDSLLALGVSLTNELDGLEALKYLKMWIENHYDYQHLSNIHKKNDNIPQSFEDMTAELVKLYENVRDLKEGLDFNVLIALGVLYNIQRNYKEAINAFINAYKLCTNSSNLVLSSLWNKIGATLANSGRSDSALLAYHQALALRPNYPRAWSNLGVAHANLGQHEDAVRFYLIALNLNEKATHLWFYLKTALVHLGRYDLIRYADNRDKTALKQNITGNVVENFTDLPRPITLLPEANNVIFFKILSLF